MQLYLHVRRLVLFIIMILSLTLVALGGVAGQVGPGHTGENIRLAYAEGCDGSNPRPDMDCPDGPTPTPTPTYTPDPTP